MNADAIASVLDTLSKALEAVPMPWVTFAGAAVAAVALVLHAVAKVSASKVTVSAPLAPPSAQQPPAQPAASDTANTIIQNSTK